MRVVDASFKVIHSDDVEIISGNDNSQLIGKISVRHEIRTIFQSHLPILLRWIYRVQKKKLETFSIVIEDEFLLLFNYEENPEPQLINLIKHSYRKIKKHWNDKIAKTSIQKDSFPELPIKSIHTIVQNILKIAKQYALLK